MSTPIYIDKNTLEDLKKDRYLDRSIESNFLKNSVAKEEVINLPKNPIEIKPISKPLASFHPLTDDEVWKINKLAEREEYGTQFSTNYVNQLLLKLADKYPQHLFLDKDKVFSYLGKCLKNEMRSLDKTNRQGFKFKSSDEKKEQERYLTAVENNIGTMQSAVLRRKIAARFDGELSYKILKSCYFHDSLDQLNDGVFEITTKTAIDLTDNQRELLLNEIKAVYEDVQNDKFIKVINFKQRQYPSVNASKQEITIDKSSTWFKISERLKAYYGEPLHKSWFSKLEPQENKELKQLTLKAPTPFIASYVKNEYQSIINQCCELEGIVLTGIME